MKAYRLAILTVASAGCLLAGCAGLVPRGTPLSSANDQVLAQWQSRRAALSQIDRFDLQARVAAKGSFGLTGSLHWRQSGDAYTAHFSGPFGSGAVDLSGDGLLVVIRSGKDRYVTDDPEAFLLHQFGWTLPVRGLRYWVLGLPAPSATAPAKLFLDAQGHVRSLLQGGWMISYEDYRNVDGLDLPRHFTMNGAKTEFRIIIDRWTIHATAPANDTQASTSP